MTLGFARDSVFSGRLGASSQPSNVRTPAHYVCCFVIVAPRPVSSVSMDTQKQMCNVYRGEWLDGMRHGKVGEPLKLSSFSNTVLV